MKKRTKSTSKRLSQDERRSALLRAAAEIFFEQGYADTSLDALIQRAGGSKRSIYTEFGSKEGLFITLVSEQAGLILSSLEHIEDSDISLRETLLNFARNLMRALMSPTVIGVGWAIIADGIRFPEIAEKYYEYGPGRSAERLAEVLESARQKGEITIKDCSLAANQFMGMLRDNTYLQILLRLRPPLTEAEQENYIHSVVDIFLEGARPR